MRAGWASRKMAFVNFMILLRKAILKGWRVGAEGVFEPPFNTFGGVKFYVCLVKNSSTLSLFKSNGNPKVSRVVVVI